MKGMRTLESELKRLFELETVMRKLLYCGNMMMAEIGEKTRVKISFSCTGIIPGDSAIVFGNRYDAVVVSIINKDKGVVDSNMFCFKDICSSYPYFVNSEKGEVVWMRETTGDFIKISRKIIAYIKMFSEFSEKENIESKDVEAKKSVEQKTVKKENPEVGDALWYVDLQNHTVIPCTVTHIQCDGLYRMMILCFHNNIHLRYPLDDYGKLFFFDIKKAYEVLRRKQTFANLKEKIKEL